MKRLRSTQGLWMVLLLVLGGLAGFLVSRVRQAAPQVRNITITAHKYAYDPPVLQVNRGDVIHLRLVAQDVTHGFYLEGYDTEAKMRPENGTFWVRRPSKKEALSEVEEISFVANRTGKFHYRCSLTCGYMHPFMQGEMIVSPNYLFPTSIGSLLGLAMGMLVLIPGANRGGQS